jgi:hypothetical protein
MSKDGKETIIEVGELDYKISGKKLHLLGTWKETPYWSLYKLDA